MVFLPPQAAYKTPPLNQPALWAEPGPPGAEPDDGLNPLNPGHRVAHGEAAPFRLAAFTTHP